MLSNLGIRKSQLLGKRVDCTKRQGCIWQGDLGRSYLVSYCCDPSPFSKDQKSVDQNPITFLEVFDWHCICYKWRID